jgi:hypothetical protein
MGNSRWRLQTTLNYVAQRVHELGREEDVEILVADWGSDVPLREVLELSPAAARLVSFILIPPEVARDLQKDSPFPEVLALNAAARRASGEYIGRIDQDTLVGKRFLEYFFELYEGKQRLETPLASALLFANQRMVPYRFCVRCPPLWAVEKYINFFGRFFKIEITSGRAFYKHGVGIWLAHRDVWNASGGYDERMIYMNSMEFSMIDRLKMNSYEVVNLGTLVDYDFHHMEHYPPLALRSSSTHRKVNPDALLLKLEILNPNGPDWGLVQYPLEKIPYSHGGNPAATATVDRPFFNWPGFMILIVFTVIQIGVDGLVKPFWKGYVTGKRRIRIARETVHHQPFKSWPRLLRNRWKEKRSVSADSK